MEFPYIPGLLGFREGPVILNAFERLSHFPDLLIFDGQGIAHPRRLGIASHIGLLLNLPSIGCAKSRLYGRHQIPDEDVAYGPGHKIVFKPGDHVEKPVEYHRTKTFVLMRSQLLMQPKSGFESYDPEKRFRDLYDKCVARG